MTDQQLYFAIGIPVFTVFMGVLVNATAILLSNRMIDKRFDAIETRISDTKEILQADIKAFRSELLSRIGAVEDRQR